MRKTGRRLLGLAAASLMAMALAVPAFAEESLTGGGASEVEAAPALSSEAAPLAEGDVAQIGDKTYATIGAAIDAANNSAESGEIAIELLQTAELDKTIAIKQDKNVVISADPNAGIQILDNNRKGITLSTNSSLTIENVTIDTNGQFYLNGRGGNLKFSNVNLNMDGEMHQFHPDGYYCCAISIEQPESNLTFDACNVEIANYPSSGSAIRWNGSGNDTGYSVSILNGSYLKSTNCYSGFVGTCDIKIYDSVVDVIDHRGNGSNGSYYDIQRSTVTYKDNGSHGISAGGLSVSDHSTVVSDSNNYYGIYTENELFIDGTSEVTVTKNSAGGDFAGFKVRPGVKNGLVESGAVLNITDNYCSGLSNNGVLTFEEGANLTITDNTNDQGGATGSHGGGIYNSGAEANLTLPSNAIIYNNHALTDGDDIFNNTTSTITFPAVGSDWKLDGFGIDGVDDDCTDAIDGWYDDSANNRWEAHADIYDGIHVEKFTDSTTSVTGLAALKAAHGLGVVSVQPADITIYMGGDEGFEGVIDGSAQVTGSNSLPEPGFYFTLSDEINQAFENAGIAPVTEAADLSQYMTIYTNNKYTGEQLNWKLEKYGETNSVANNKFIYRIVPAPTEGQEAVPVRLQFTSEDGSQTFTNDTFDPTATDALYEQYTMQLYTELVNADQVVFEVEVPGKDNMPAQHFYNGMKLDTGKLTIRYVTGEQDDVVTGVVADIADAEQAGERAYAQVSESAKFFINGSDVDVTAAAAPSLLFDDVVSDYSTPGAESYDVQLAARAGDVVASEGTDMANPWYQAKYLDLVDANNGNVWLTSSEPVTVYWPYPEGTDQNTEFHLVHFQGLDREMGTADIESAIAGAQTEYVEVENTEHGVRFTTDGFSPFVLMWDAGEEAGDQPEPPVAGDKGDGSFAATGDGAGPVALAVLACAALAAAVTLAAGRRALGRG